MLTHKALWLRFAHWKMPEYVPEWIIINLNNNAKRYKEEYHAYRL